MVDAWERIAAWCFEHAPETAAAIRPSAGEDTFNWAHRSSAPNNWPEPLWAFYRWCDGTERTPAGYLFPGFRPLPLTEIVSTWRDLMRASYPGTAPSPSTPDDDLGRAFDQQAIDLSTNDAQVRDVASVPAGTPSGRFFPALLPIAEDQSGSLLVCDRRWKLRSHYGAIAVFDRDEGWTRPAPWRSLSALAAATATALRTGDPVAGTRLRPGAIGGQLTWTSAGRDALDLSDSTHIDLASGGRWKALPGTDLQVRATTIEPDGRVELSYRRTPS